MSTPVSQGFPSLFAALRTMPPTPMVRLRCGSRAVDIAAPLLSLDTTVSCPQYPYLLSYLHTAECQCTCKTFLLPNFSLSTEDLDYLDSTPFGAKIVSPSATMLGLFLHSPLQSVAPRFSQSGTLLSALPPFSIQHIEQSQLSKASAKMIHRVKAGSHLGLSFREHTLFLSFYVLSLPHYHHSILLPSKQYIATYYRVLRQFLCKRPWVQSQQLPGIVSYLKLGILHCPRIFMYSSLLGYCLRAYGDLLLLWLSNITDSLPSLPQQLVSGLLMLKSSVHQADPHNTTPFHVQLYRYLVDAPPPHKLSRQICRLFKLHLTRELHFRARDFLRARLAQVPLQLPSTPYTSTGYAPLVY